MSSDYFIQGLNQIGPSSICYLKVYNIRTSILSTRGAFGQWDCYRSPASAVCVPILTALKSFIFVYQLLTGARILKQGLHSAEQLAQSYT